MTGLVALDIGGTHARFALAGIGADGAIALDEPQTLRTSDYDCLELAWREFERRCGCRLPQAAAIAIAGPVAGGIVRMTNNSWVVDTAQLKDRLGLSQISMLNDFGAVAHAAAQVPDSDFLHISGPDRPLPASGTISVIGPGTGLGIAHFWRDGAGGYHVQATEGAHIEFGPVDALDNAILARLRTRHDRVSVERVVSGPGIVEIYQALAHGAGVAAPEQDDLTLWETGLNQEDGLAKAAVDRFCLSLGSIAGDYALAHGAGAVVIAGGLGYRLRNLLPRSGFAERFRFKGRYEGMMANIPVKLLTHPQPGLFGAAAAFQRQFSGDTA